MKGVLVNPRNTSVALLACLAGACLVACRATTAGAPGLSGPAAAPPLDLHFEDFFERGPSKSTLAPSAALLAARGKRVRLVGFMAQMDLPPPQGFYLTRRPLVCDEAGGGTADLPPDAVRVLVIPAPAVAIPFVPGPIEVVGRLDVGRLEESNGTVSQIRLLLKGDDPSRQPSHQSLTSVLHQPTGG